MHLPVTVQAVLTHDKTPACGIHARETMQTPYVCATAPATTATAATTTVSATTTTATAQTCNLAMALLTQLRTLAIEQRGMVRTMHVVAQGTILRDREVFPQKGPALLCMTGVAVLIHCQLLQGRRSGAAMRVVAVAADHLALPDGMRGGPEGLGTNILVTPKADLGLGGAFAHLVGLVNGMTAGTGKVLAFVDTGLPVQKHPALVASPAHIILLVGWRRIITRVGDQPAHVITFCKNIDDMGFTLAVACLATLRRKGRAQIHFLAVLVVINLHYMRGVALATGLTIEIARTAGGCGLGRFLCRSFRMQAAGTQGQEQKYQGSCEDVHRPAVFLAVPQTLQDSGNTAAMKLEIFPTNSAVFIDLNQQVSDLSRKHR